MEFSCDVAHNQSYYSERKFMNSLTFHYIAILLTFWLCPSPFVHLSLSFLSVCLYFFSSSFHSTPDYAEQLRNIQKAKDKLEFTLEKHQDCTYFSVAHSACFICLWWLSSSARFIYFRCSWLLFFRALTAIPLNGEIHLHTFDTGFCFIQLSQCHSL